MRPLALIKIGLGFVLIFAGSMNAAAVTDCTLVPGANVASPNDVSFSYGVWTAAGFTCEQGDKIYSNFNPGAAPTDTTVRVLLQNIGGGVIANTILFEGSFASDVQIAYSITLDTGVSTGKIYRVSGDIQNPSVSGAPSNLITVFGAGGFTGSLTSTMASPGVPISVPNLTSLNVTDVHTANGGAATNIGHTFLASQPSNCAPPVISGISATPNSLWPANHKLTNVTINYSVASACPATCTLGVATNEGSVASESQVVDAHHVFLDADRDVNGSGRIYTITATCTNAGGVPASGSTTVTVPR